MTKFDMIRCAIVMIFFGNDLFVSPDSKIIGRKKKQRSEV